MMVMIKKSFTALVTIILVVTFLTPSMVNSQIATSYASNNGVYPVAFTLTVYSPDQHSYYFDTVHLNFSVIWTDFPKIGPFEFVSDTPVMAYYAYVIDSNPSVSILANQTFFTKDFYALPSFSYNLDISKLTNGNHQIAFIVQMYYLYNGQPSSLLINQTTAPVDFLVQNSKMSTPTPTVQEFSWLMILPLFLSIISIVALIVKRKVSDSL
jgi:hypothetical protein